MAPNGPRVFSKISYPQGIQAAAPSQASLIWHLTPRRRQNGRREGRDLRLPFRAIPTRVGKSGVPAGTSATYTGHPHAGGEIHFKHTPVFLDLGPSPRGWGNRESRSCRDRSNRAIPTRVGKSYRQLARRLFVAGHPHAGGEIGVVQEELSYIVGPSPRGWGNLHGSHDDLWWNRAIPTRVGKSGEVMMSIPKSTGHPHAGGEILERPWPVERVTGPSPRGWGNQEVIGFYINRTRAIPTRVGKSSVTRIGASPASGHPHAGGEIHVARAIARRVIGPSPRGWGNL